MNADKHAPSSHWGKDDVYTKIVDALAASGKSLDRLTVEDLMPADHFHARGFQATIELADHLPVKSGDHLLDIGCGLGGPARYFARRFDCKVTGVDITPQFVEAAEKFNSLLGMESQIEIRTGDGLNLPCDDLSFDGILCQHVTMNIADRPRFFSEARRVLKPGGFFAVTEHGLGPAGDPHFPVPWSEDGTGSCLITPEETRGLLESAGFVKLHMEDAGSRYLNAYLKAIARSDAGKNPILGTHLLMGENAALKTRNSARNIEEKRTRPVEIICSKPE